MFDPAGVCVAAVMMQETHHMLLLLLLLPPAAAAAAAAVLSGADLGHVSQMQAGRTLPHCVNFINLNLSNRSTGATTPHLW
jgi:hypothetical protein